MTDFFAGVSDAVLRGDKEDALQQVKKAYEAGIEPAKIIAEGLTTGLYGVGEKFEAGEYFLPDMMMAAEAMAAALEYLEPFIKEGQRETRAGRMVIGTVKGDLHSIGKNIVIMMMKSAGFEVFDLGVDVATPAFIEAVREKKADILGISALMTTTISEQKRVIELLQENGLREKVKVLVGGAPLSEEWARKIGADGYAPDAIAGVKKAKALLGIS